MNRNKAILKYREIERSQEKRKQYRLHLERQDLRLNRISHLLKLSQEQTQEVIELMVGWLNGTGLFKQGTIRIANKRIQ
jgi:hypothetical protein